MFKGDLNDARTVYGLTIFGYFFLAIALSSSGLSLMRKTDNG